MEPCVVAQLIFVFGFFAVVGAWILRELLKPMKGCPHVKSWEVIAVSRSSMLMRCKECGKRWVER